MAVTMKFGPPNAGGTMRMRSGRAAVIVDIVEKVTEANEDIQTLGERTRFALRLRLPHGRNVWSCCLGPLFRGNNLGGGWFQQRRSQAVA
jgi:hypothetical protein